MMTLRATRTLLLAACAALATPALAQDKPAEQPATAPPVEVQQPVPEAIDSPKIKLDVAKHDWGKVTDLDLLHQEFKFTNTGKGKLILQDVKPSCGCVKPRLRDNKREYAPGESGWIDTTFEPGSKQGQVNQHIDIRSNDPENPVAKIDVGCFVLATVMVEPHGTMSIDPVARGTKVVKKILVTGRTPDFKATYATVSGDTKATVQVGETKEVVIDNTPMRQTTIELTVPENMDAGKFEQTVYIRHNDKRIGILNVVVSGEVLGDVRADRGTIALGVVAPETAVSGEFKIENVKKTAFKINGTRFKLKQGPAMELTITTAPGEKGDSYTVSFSGKAPARPGTIQGNVEIITDIKGEPVIKVPLNLTVRTPGA